MTTYIYVKPYDKDEQHLPESWTQEHRLDNIYKFDGIEAPKSQYVGICVFYNHANPIHKALLMSKETTLWRFCRQMHLKDDILTFECVASVNTHLFYDDNELKALFDFEPLDGVVKVWQDEATE